MIRRDYPIFALGLGIGIAATVLAGQARQPELMNSGVYAWESLPVETTATGERRAVFDSATRTLDRLETHVTTVKPGTALHAPHRHPDEELMFVREGVLEASINGTTQRAPAGSVIFFAAGDLHGVRNAGDTQASYFVLRWTSPGKEGPKPGGSK
ncbi:MAG: cupin domain-containing protein [Pseudomonadota bacterium]